MPDLMQVSLALAVLAPLLASVVAGSRLLLRDTWLPERAISRTTAVGLGVSLTGSVGVLASWLGLGGVAGSRAVEFGSWVRIGTYEIPAVLVVDQFSIAFSMLGAALTLLVARFCVTYLHKEAGFARFFVLLGLFASGTQLVAFAGALDLFFAGWEAIGIASALFIGYFHERPEPVRSAIRAFATYRLCDVGFLVAIVSTHELLGSTRLSDMPQAGALPAIEVTVIAVLLLLAAFGKSAQLPFSAWLVRAMEGPTPSSALFYGAVSIHAGLYLLLRTSSLLEAAPLAAALGVTVGLLTAIYAATTARTHADAKGALAQATLAQTGLILAEICLGLTTIALVHLVSHAMLRAWQYLRTPNLLHDAHSHGHHHAHAGTASLATPGRAARRLYLAQLHRFRLDDRLDAAAAPVLRLARVVTRLDDWYLRRVVGDREGA